MASFVHTIAGLIAIAILALVAIFYVVRFIVSTISSGASSQEDGAEFVSPADRVNRLADEETSSAAANIEEQPDPVRKAEPRKRQNQSSYWADAGAMPSPAPWVMFVVLGMVISRPFSNFSLAIFLLSVVALVVGIYVLTFARVKDRENYVIQKATPLSLEMANVRDDVWLNGVTECESPLVAPHFEVSCLFYEYERLQQKTVILPKKEFPYFYTEKVWTRVETKSEDTSLFLRDGEQVIDIDGNAGDLIDHRESRYVQIGRIAHSLEYVPHPMELSAIGSISEGKHRLEAHANIPLLVTTEDRKDSVRTAEDNEKAALHAGLLFCWFGLAGLFGLFDSGFSLLAIALPTIFVTLYWGILKHNILVDYRNRVENAWHQVDIDLTMRYELIPDLVASVKGAMNHERDWLNRLVKMRSKAVANKEEKLRLESKIVESVGTIVARVERYPNLIAQGTIQELIRQLCAIDEKIAHGRMVYNDAVHEYNNNVSMFPQMLIAEKFGFELHQFFTIPEKEVALPDANWG